MDSAGTLLTKSSPSKKKRKSEAPEQEPIDVVVDTIIGLLEHSTSFSRAMANRSFSMITPLVKESTMDLILVVSVLHLNFYLYNCNPFLAIGTT